ncbi:MAG: ABC transporter permease [Anaerolineae bacterium]|jgi:ABC-type polysaccharide/polyol phosphate export permease
MMGRFVELYHYRALIKNLVIRDLKIRYKNSILGVLWSLLNPLLMTLVFTIVFSFMLGSDIPDYPVFFMSGYLPWSFFAASVATSTTSIVSNAPLVKKVYFPREVLPLSGVLSELVNFLLALIVLFGLIFAFSLKLTPAILMLPLIILAQTFFVLGLGFFLATANVFYRDTQHIMQVVMQAWFFLTPIFYPITTLPESAEILGMTVNVQLWVRRLNPMASLVAAYRDILFHGVPTGWDFFVRTFITCLTVLVIGYLIFCRFSPVFGEEI